MTELNDLTIRESAPGDAPAIAALYPAAFPDEDLLPVVRELLRAGPDVLSLVGTVGPSLVAHVAYTICGVSGSDQKVALLAPLAVTPARQGKGIGTAILRAGLARLEDAGVTGVCVLGDPAYYGRFGFTPEADIAPPYPLPAEWQGAWQWLGLARAERPGRGQLIVPPFWQKPELWTA